MFENSYKKPKESEVPKYPRDLLWLVLLCAVAVGWWVDRRSLRSQLNAESNNRNVWIQRAEALRVWVEMGHLLEGRPASVKWEDDTGDLTITDSRGQRQTFTTGVLR